MRAISRMPLVDRERSITNIFQSTCKLGICLWRRVLCGDTTTAYPRPGCPLSLRFGIGLRPHFLSPLRPLSRIRIATAHGIIVQNPLGSLARPTLQRITHDCARLCERGRTCLEFLDGHGGRLTLSLAFPVPYWRRRGRRCHLDILRGWKRYSAFGRCFW